MAGENCTERRKRGEKRNPERDPDHSEDFRAQNSPQPKTKLQRWSSFAKHRKKRRKGCY
jgi:hypothetical protein